MYKTKKQNFHTSKTEESILFFWIRDTCVTQRKFENQGFITEVTKIPALINDWENIIAYLEESKQSKALVEFTPC